MPHAKVAKYMNLPTLSTGHEIRNCILAAPAQRLELSNIFVALAPEQLHLSADVDQRIGWPKIPPVTIVLNNRSTGQAYPRLRFELRDQLFVVIGRKRNIGIQKT